MKSILILNGPNLNLLGRRETEIYGDKSFEDYFLELRNKYPKTILHYYQSNHEGVLIDKLHQYGFELNGIILNTGAYTHTSIAIADAIKAIESPVIEVHISNVYQRESFRHHSYVEAVAKHSIIGEGLKGYELAIDFILESDF